jgi:tetratricopeptide (TPR) repeat protein
VPGTSVANDRAGALAAPVALRQLARMTRDLTETEVREHNRHYQEGWALIRDDIFLAGSRASGPPGWFARRRLTKAIACFEAALAINPGGWPSLWALGKIQQRLGRRAEALEAFSRAHVLAPVQPDVAREAGIAAAEVGDGTAAVRFVEAAIAASPADGGLQSNLALARLLCGDLVGAREAVDRAAALLPDEAIVHKVRRVVDDVAGGRRPPPRTLGEIR